MKPLPLAQWDDALRHVLDDMNGRPLNVHGLMANHPALLDAWWSYRNYSVAGGALAERDRELVILRVAVHMKNWYEWASHVDRGLAAGLSLDDVLRVALGPGAPDWGERDALLLQAVDELIDERAIRTATQKRLAAHFSQNQLMDIVAIHGMYITLGCMINTWDVELDEHVEKRLPTTVTRERFEKASNSAS